MDTTYSHSVVPLYKEDKEAQYTSYDMPTAGFLLDYLSLPFAPSIAYEKPQVNELTDMAALPAFGADEPLLYDLDCLYTPAESVSEDSGQFHLELNSFSDLQTVVTVMGEPCTNRSSSQSLVFLNDMATVQPATQNGYSERRLSWVRRTSLCSRRHSQREAMQRLAAAASTAKLPPSAHLDMGGTSMLESLMDRAVSHWCCIGFKVAPISLDMIRNWRRAPLAIVYSVASISMVTFMDHNVGQWFVRDAATAFYQQACQKMDDVFQEEIRPSTIQAYFCLSYTSNLLRLYEQQRTWGGLASIALHHQANKRMKKASLDDMTWLCLYRWYYVDSWMCLTLNQECLLPDDLLTFNEQIPPCEARDNVNLYQFAVLSRFTRRYIRAMRSGKLFDPTSQATPSALYYGITKELTAWYAQQTSNTSAEMMGIHFQICYHAMRLVVLFQFLQPQQSPPNDILIDCLEINLSLLQLLQYLKDVGCDQSTYHHMFLAIHNTAKRIYTYSDGKQCAQLKPFACDQLRINLMLLRGTRAYANDVFQVRDYAERIEQQFRDLGISLENWLETDKSTITLVPRPAGASHVHPHACNDTRHQHLPSQHAGMFVFRKLPMQFPTKKNRKPRTQRTVQLDKSIHTRCS